MVVLGLYIVGVLGYYVSYRRILGLPRLIALVCAMLWPLILTIGGLYLLYTLVFGVGLFQRSTVEAGYRWGTNFRKKILFLTK